MGVVRTIKTAVKNNTVSSLISTITHMAVGTDATTPAGTDTALNSETDRDAVFSTGTGPASASINLFLDTTENNGNDIKEVGTFDDPSAGNMYNRALTNVISKDSSTEVFIEVKFVIVTT